MLSSKSKIFITGATGFVGSYILRKLIADGQENIYCLKRKQSDFKLAADVAAKVHWVDGDILDIPSLEKHLCGMDIVIHAAAIVTFHTKNKKMLIETAMTGTANLVNVAMHCEVKKFIHISSIAAIGRRKKKEDIDEKLMFSHSEFDTTYGLSKFLAEQEVWRAHAEGLFTTILSPSMVLGAGHWENSSVQIFKKVYQGIKYFPEGVNGWVDVRDVAEAVSLAIKGDFNGERFIISAENIHYQNMFAMIAEQLKVKPPILKFNYLWSGIIWRLEAIRSLLLGSKPIITKETIVSTAVESYYDNKKSIRLLGINYRDMQITIKDSCDAFINSWPKGEKGAIFGNL
jgi:dihydroflavonol-4-reductase